MKKTTKVYTCEVKITVDQDEAETLNFLQDNPIEKLKTHLSEALRVDLDTETYGNPFGVVGVEVDLENLKIQK